MNSLKDVFISYGRRDSRQFAKLLHDRLVSCGYSVWFDFNDIPTAVDFQKQIDEAIPKVDNFIFVISPHATNSEYCLKEIERAVSLNKRLIPIMHVEKIAQEIWQTRNPSGTNDDWATYQASGKHSCFTSLHSAIGRINWNQLDFQDPTNFEQPFQALVDLLEDERPYIHQHTELLNKALEWKHNQQQTQYLLIGEERQQAEAWLKHRFQDKQPPCIPTDLQCEFITESIKNANNLMTQVFLCHAEQDRTVTEKIRHILMRAGITTWTHHTDIVYGTDFQLAMNRGVEEADNVLFLMSPHAFQSQYCQQELNKALALNKRIIPLQIRALDLAQVPDSLKKLQHIDLTPNQTETAYQQNISALLRVLRQDAPYYNEHKILLTKALKWKQQHRNPCILLRGYELRHVLAWQRVAQKRSRHGLTNLQTEFIRASEEQPAEVHPDVFISYSRVNSDFARRLNDNLQRQGKRTWFDQESITPGSADFHKEIYQGIAASNFFLFVLSPRSVNSPYCADEVEYAAKLNKQIVTVLHRPVDTNCLHPELAKVQWIDFNNHGTDFVANFQELLRRLDTDSDHLQVHRRLSLRAIEWEEKQRRKDFLLQGNDLAEAEQWLLKALPKKPKPTELQGDYISASRQFSRRRQRTWISVLSFLLTAAMIACGFAWHQYGEARIARNEAEQGRKDAINARDEAENQRKIAQREKQKAIQALSEAENQQKIAQQEEQKAIQARNNAIASQAAEKKQRELAQQEQQKAIKSRKNAENAKNREAEQRAEAEKQEQIAQAQAHLSQTEAFLLAQKSMEGRITAIKVGQAIQSASQPATEATAYALAALQKVTYPDLAFNLQRPTAFKERNRLNQQSRVFSVSFSPDGYTIASGSEDGSVKLWDTNGKLVKTLTGHQDPVRSLDFSSDGSIIVSGSADGTIKLWNHEGDELDAFSGHPAGVITSVRFSPNGQTIATASSDRTVKLWSLTGQEITTLIGHKKSIRSVAYSPDGQLIASASKDKTIKLWNSNGQLIQTLDGHEEPVRSVSFSPNSQMIVSGGEDGTIKLWSRDGEIITTVAKHQGDIYSVIFSPDGQLIASSSEDGTVKLWKLQGSAIELKLMDTLIGHRGAVNSISFNPQQDRQTLISGSDDSTLKLWEGNLKEIVTHHSEQKEYRQTEYFSWQDDELHIHTLNTAEGGKPTQKMYLSQVYDVSPDRQTIAAVSKDGEIQLRTQTGTLIKTLPGHQGDIYSVHFSPDGQMLVSGGEDTTVKLWTLNGSNSPITLRGHQKEVYSVRFSDDSQTIASGSRDKTVKLWSRNSRTAMATLAGHTKPVVSVGFVKDDQTLVSRDNDGNINLWERNLEKLLERNCNWLEKYLKNNSDGQLEAQSGVCKGYNIS